MKKIVLMMSILFSGFFANGQTALQLGTNTLGGSASYSHVSGDGGITKTEVDIAPIITTFIADHIELGLGFNYHYDKSELKYLVLYYGQTQLTTQTISIESKLFGLTPQMNFYFLSDETMSPFIGGGISFLVNPDQTSNKQFDFSGKGGLVVFIKEYASVKLFAEYKLSTFSQSDSKVNTIAIGIGMNYYLLND